MIEEDGLGAVSVIPGRVVSITIALFTAKFTAGEKLVIGLREMSAIVPVTEVTVRSEEFSPACTV